MQAAALSDDPVKPGRASTATLCPDAPLLFSDASLALCDIKLLCVPTAPGTDTVADVASLLVRTVLPLWLLSGDGCLRSPLQMTSSKRILSLSYLASFDGSATVAEASRRSPSKMSLNSSESCALSIC